VRTENLSRVACGGFAVHSKRVGDRVSSVLILFRFFSVQNYGFASILFVSILI
jgi:hypothetical protein